jgi:catechol 2,3-dioxygenase-like lactoylglutathione lyase family enzyme
VANSLLQGCAFHHVSINVKDFEGSVKFYKALGMTVFVEFSIGDGGRHCFIDVGDGPYLELHSTTESRLRESRMQHFCFHVTDADAAYKIALENGARTKEAPFDFDLRCAGMTIHARICHVYGPDGESIEFINWRNYDPENYTGFLERGKE